MFFYNCVFKPCAPVRESAVLGLDGGDGPRIPSYIFAIYELDDGVLLHLDRNFSTHFSTHPWIHGSAVATSISIPAVAATAAYIRRLRAELAAAKRDNDKFVAAAVRDTRSRSSSRRRRSRRRRSR